MEIKIMYENFMPSHLLIVSGIGIMALSENIDLNPVQAAVRNIGSTVALTGVLSGFIEQTIEQALSK